jgi:sulfate adenylyltransferase subunit 1
MISVRKQQWKIVNDKDIFRMEKSQLLRFTTAGSVDDGKSTLIGRLLYDSKSTFEDQVNAISESSKKKGFEGIDLALFTDGLRDEREQGITIDVAYRYFATPKRKFIIADAPGHVQYTRNMVTGTSNANAVIILIDATKGVSEQTKRHSYIASLLYVGHVIVAINKMDLVDYKQEVFDQIVSDYEDIASKLVVKDIQYIPMSALKGDNVVNHSDNMPWYKGASLLYTLENLHISSDDNKVDARFPVQTVLRPQTEEYREYRGYAGQIGRGIFRKGDEVTILPSGFTSKIKSIDTYDGELETAFTPMSIAMQLEDDIDISRGDMIVKSNNQPECIQDIEAMICWLGSSDYLPRTKFSLYHTTNVQKAMIKDIVYKMDINSLERNMEDKAIGMNDICRVKIRTNGMIMADEYRENRETGSFILVDDHTNETVAAGMIIR